MRPAPRAALPLVLAALVTAGLSRTLPWLTAGHALVGALQAAASVACWRAATARIGGARLGLHALAGALACGLVPWLGFGFRSLALPCLAGHAAGLLASRPNASALGAGALAAWSGAQAMAGLYALAFFLFPAALTTAPPWHLIRPSPDGSMWTLPRFGNHWSLRSQRGPTWGHRNLHVRVYDGLGGPFSGIWPDMYGLTGRWHGPRLAWTRPDQLQLWWYLETDDAIERWTRTCAIDPDPTGGRPDVRCGEAMLDSQPLPLVVAAHRRAWRSLRYGR